MEKELFLKYLTHKKKKKDFIEDCASFMDHLTASFEAIGDFHEQAAARRRAAVKTVYRFLVDYLKFSEKEQSLIAEVIQSGCRQSFEQTVKNIYYIVLTLLKQFPGILVN